MWVIESPKGEGRGEGERTLETPMRLAADASGSWRVAGNLYLDSTGHRLGGPAELSLQDPSGRFGWVRLVPPHPCLLPQGEGTPHPALQRAEALWIGESASSDSPSPQGRAGVRGKQRSKHQCACELRMNSTTQAPCAPRFNAETPARHRAFDSPPSGGRFSLPVPRGKGMHHRNVVYPADS